MAPVRHASARRAYSPKSPSSCRYSASPSPESSPDLGSPDLRADLAQSNDGLPTQARFEELVQNYLDNMCARKKEKALIDDAYFNNIVAVLFYPNSKKICTPQFRFWVRKMFELGPYPDGSLGPVHGPDKRPVATKSQIYDILCHAHASILHAGRDKTMAKVREEYSWIPKELVAAFVKACPTCAIKRSFDQNLLELVMDDIEPASARTPMTTSATPRPAVHTRFPTPPFAWTIDASTQLEEPVLKDIDAPWAGGLGDFRRPSTASSLASSYSSSSSTSSVVQSSFLEDGVPMARSYSAPASMPPMLPGSPLLLRTAPALESDRRTSYFDVDSPGVDAFYAQPFFTAPLSTDTPESGFIPNSVTFGLEGLSLGPSAAASPVATIIDVSDAPQLFPTLTLADAMPAPGFDVTQDLSAILQTSDVIESSVAEQDVPFARAVLCPSTIGLDTPSPLSLTMRDDDVEKLVWGVTNPFNSPV